MNIAGNAQVVGESLVAIKGVEISELGIDVELQQKRHFSVLAGFPDYHSISVTTVVCLWCRNGVRCRHRGSCRCRYNWLTGDRYMRCRAAVKPLLQTVYLFKKYLLLLLHLAEQFSD